MKPRIVMDRGVWCCGRPIPGWTVFAWPVGHGYSPKEAYDDWEAQIKGKK